MRFNTSWCRKLQAEERKSTFIQNEHNKNMLKGETEMSIFQT